MISLRSAAAGLVTFAIGAPPLALKSWIFRAWKFKKGGVTPRTVWQAVHPGSELFYCTQLDATRESSKAYRRVIIEIQGKQLALQGWNYARCFRS